MAHPEKPTAPRGVLFVIGMLLAVGMVALWVLAPSLLARLQH